jgi:aerotaxis receptor
MARPTLVPRDYERPFGFDELFFSTTDRRGVITSGNDVFVRVSGHSRERLIGSPHNVIRHPDMPRAVFKLFWDYLEAGNPFAGYVKNMAADGGYYWVVALVVPTGAGYLSVRLKPSSPLFPVAKELYASLLAIEHAAGSDRRDGMEQARAALLDALRGKGFNGYDDFMHTLLSAEMSQRDARADCSQAAQEPGHASEFGTMRGECLGVQHDLRDLFSRVEGFLDLIRTLDDKAIFLRQLAANVHLVALNAVVASCRLRDGGDGFAVVTQSLAATSQASSGTIERMNQDLTTMTSSLRDTAFSIMAAKLQIEMMVFFLKELITASEGDGRLPPDEHLRREIGMLANAFSTSFEQLAEAVPRARAVMPALMRHHDLLSDDLRTLNRVRLLGKIHAVGLAEEAHFRELLDSILEQLQQAGAELDALSSGIAELAGQLPGLASAASAMFAAVKGLQTVKRFAA